MHDCKKRQEEGFTKLKGILQERETSETVQGYIARMERVFTWYIIEDLNWKMVHCMAQGKNGDELEDFMANLVKVVESYEE